MTYGVTWGEGDGAGLTSGMNIIKSATMDIIADSTGGNFATAVSLTSEIAGIVAGDAIRVTARGIFSTYGSAGTIELKVKNGGSVLLTTGAQTVGANLADRGWWIDAVLIQLASGSNNQGTFMFSNTARLWDAMDMENGADDATNVNVGSIIIEVAWGTADPSNSINLRQLIVERIPNG